MTRHNLKNRLAVSQSLAPQELTGAANGTSVDIKAYGGVLAVLDVGVATGTSPTCDIRLEESADNSTFGAVAAADLVGGLVAQLTDANDAQVYERGYLGSKRYLRWACTATGGTSPVFPLSASIIGGNARREPV